MCVCLKENKKQQKKNECNICMHCIESEVEVFRLFEKLIISGSVSFFVLVNLSCCDHVLVKFSFGPYFRFFIIQELN